MHVFGLLGRSVRLRQLAYQGGAAREGASAGGIVWQARRGQASAAPCPGGLKSPSFRLRRASRSAEEVPADGIADDDDDDDDEDDEDEDDDDDAEKDEAHSADGGDGCAAACSSTWGAAEALF